MRALVAEANVVTRVTFRRLLERAGFSVDELRDELAATCLLYQPDAPELALLALDTLLVDFGQICAAIRAAKPDVYIVALIPDSRRFDVGAVLDAGADDFIIKPVTIQEGEARVRVIRRFLDAAGGSPRADEAEELALRAQNSPEEEKKELAQFLRDLDFPDAFRTVFSLLGLGPVLELDRDATGDRPFVSGWAPMLLHQGERAQWLNMRIDVDQHNAEALFNAIHPKAAYSHSGVLDLLREIMNLAQDGIRVATSAYEEASIYIPVAPMALPSDQLPSPSSLASAYARFRQVGLSLADDVRLTLSITMEPVPVKEHPITGLRATDVLASAIESDEYQTILLRAGAMLTDSYIEKIQTIVHVRDHKKKVKVFPPPSGTAAFLVDHMTPAV